MSYSGKTSSLSGMLHFIKAAPGLSNAFDWITHDHLTAIFDVYGLPFSALKLTQDYLRNRKEKAKSGRTTGLLRNFYLASLKVQFWDHFNIFCFSSLNTTVIILTTMRMMPHLTLQVIIQQC